MAGGIIDIRSHPGSGARVSASFPAGPIPPGRQLTKRARNTGLASQILSFRLGNLEWAPPAINSAASEPKAIATRLASLILAPFLRARLSTRPSELASEPHGGDTRAASGDPWKGDKLGDWTT